MDREIGNKSNVAAAEPAAPKNGKLRSEPLTLGLAVTEQGTYRYYNDIGGLPPNPIVVSTYNQTAQALKERYADSDQVEYDGRLSTGVRASQWLAKNDPNATPEMLAASILYLGHHNGRYCPVTEDMSEDIQRLIICMNILTGHYEAEEDVPPDPADVYRATVKKNQKQTSGGLTSLRDRVKGTVTQAVKDVYARSGGADLGKKVFDGYQSLRAGFNQGAELIQEKKERLKDLLEKSAQPLVYGLDRMRYNYHDGDMKQAVHLILATGAAIGEFKNEFHLHHSQQRTPDVARQALMATTVYLPTLDDTGSGGDCRVNMFFAGDDLLLHQNDSLMHMGTFEHLLEETDLEPLRDWFVSVRQDKEALIDASCAAQSISSPFADRFISRHRPRTPLEPGNYFG